MSASRIPMRQPSAARLRARLTAVVDLPTPPLPDATAMILATPGMAILRCAGALAVGGGAFAACLSAVRLTRALETPLNFLTAASAADRIGSIAAERAGSTAIET